MLPVDALFSVEPGAVSTVRVAGRDSLFDAPQSERQFQRGFEAAVWHRSFELRLSDRAGQSRPPMTRQLQPQSAEAATSAKFAPGCRPARDPAALTCVITEASGSVAAVAGARSAA
jgi:hypothetical protein